MAHVAKHPRSATGHLCKHYERAKDEQGEYLKFGNQDIDPAKTVQNYNLAPDHDGGQVDFIRRRCSEVKCMNRKDVNVLCSWMVTAPKVVADTEIEKDFFKKTYDFLKDRYGQQNVVSAYVHKDEFTPHMHFAFVPVVEYQHKKTKEIGYKVSAKELLTKTDLQSFHSDLEQCLTRHFGYELGIQNEATREGNRSVEQLKRGTAAEQLKQINQKASRASQEAQRAVDKLNHVTAEENALQVKIAAHKGTFQMFHEIDAIGKSTITGKITMTADEAQKLKEQAKAYWASQSRARYAEAAADQLHSRYSNLERNAPELCNEILALRQERDTATKDLNRIKEIIKSSPDLVKAFNDQLRVVKDMEREQRQEQERGLSMGYER